MRVVQVSLERHCTPEVAARALNEAGESFAHDSPVGVIIDMLGVSIYEMASRSIFVEWANANKAFIHRIAAVTGNAAWHIIISTMNSDIDVEMCPFYVIEDAEKWARSAH